MFQYRLALCLTLFILVPLGFATKSYQGWLATWVNHYAGDIVYEVFWMVLVSLIFPRSIPAKIGWGVFLATSAIEFLQLWHTPALDAFRASFIGKTLLGTTFTWEDFPYYALGCLVGWGWLRYLRDRTLTPTQASVSKD